MIDQKLIDRINELASIAKQRELTPEEVIERDELRKKYISEFRKGFAQRLSAIKVVDENGNDETPNKKGEA